MCARIAIKLPLFNGPSFNLLFLRDSSVCQLNKSAHLKPTKHDLLPFGTYVLQGLKLRNLPDVIRTDRQTDRKPTIIIPSRACALRVNDSSFLHVLVTRKRKSGGLWGYEYHYKCQIFQKSSRYDIASQVLPKILDLEQSRQF